MNLSNKILMEINLFTFQVGPTYGRKMMSGYVRSKGLTLSGKQVSKSLRRVNPVSHARRTEDTVRRRNPVPYYAPYHGNKLHCDQNEKLGMCGCMDVWMYAAPFSKRMERRSISTCLLEKKKKKKKTSGTAMVCHERQTTNLDQQT